MPCWRSTFILSLYIMFVISIASLGVVVFFWARQYQKVQSEVTAYRFLNLLSPKFVTGMCTNIARSMSQMEEMYAKRLQSGSFREKMHLLAASRQAGANSFIDSLLQFKYRLATIGINFALMVLQGPLDRSANSEMRYSFYSADLTVLATLDPTLNDTDFVIAKAVAFDELENFRTNFTNANYLAFGPAASYQLPFVACPPASQIVSICPLRPRQPCGNDGIMDTDGAQCSCATFGPASRGIHRTRS
jgi:hypothetical protein